MSLTYEVPVINTFHLTQEIDPCRRSQFLVLTKRGAASKESNGDSAICKIIMNLPFLKKLLSLLPNLKKRAPRTNSKIYTR